MMRYLLNLIKKLPLVREIVKKFQDFERCQSEMLRNLEAVQEKLEQTKEECSQLHSELQTVRSDMIYRYYMLLPISEYGRELKYWYKSKTGKELDLENPLTYNEKIQWLKLYDSTPLKTRLSDKYAVREWVKEKIGAQYLIPLLGVWDSFEEIDIESLPNQFVLKANHGCGWNIIVKDKSTFDIGGAKAKFDLWMSLNFAFMNGFELQYRDIVPKIIAEQYIENNEEDLFDYKVFCFNGKAESIMFLSDREKELHMSFYNRNWEKQQYVYSYTMHQQNIPSPPNLEMLIELAEKLAAGFPHVRVDFYLPHDGHYKFGEMTFTSYSGWCHWQPLEQDQLFGDLIVLPPKGQIYSRMRTSSLPDDI